MKKYTLFILVAAAAFASCESHTYEDIQDDTVIVGNVTYDAHVKTIIDNNCISCHADGGSASFRPLTTYSEVKDAVENTDLLDRIQRQNGEDGLMPQTGRMAQSKIDVILQWNTDGLLEN